MASAPPLPNPFKIRELMAVALPPSEHRRRPAAAQTVHVPVMLREVIKGLELTPGLTVVDGTVGGGGHARTIATAIGPTGRLIGLDRDASTLARTAETLTAPNITLEHASYIELPAVLQQLGLTHVDRILVDLGLSSDQLNDDARGFSFHSDGPLDLRFDATQGMPAWQWLDHCSTTELERVLHDYGEEPHARKIAVAILTGRGTAPVRTARQLAELVERALGGPAMRDRHPATQVFQALRIAVNRELEHVETALSDIFPKVLGPGGLLAVISFHSLEDRLAKDAFRDANIWDNLTPKPILATPAEQRVNPRSRSAKLRIARRKPTP